MQTDDEKMRHAIGLMTLGAEFAALAEDQAVWSRATFGGDRERGPEGALKHLAKEAVEALEAWEKPQWNVDDVRSEFADCLLLLLDASRRAGMDPLSLVRAGAEKMRVNKARKWSKPVDGQPVEHVRE